MAFKIEESENIAGSSACASRGPRKERAERLACQGIEVCVKSKASVTFQPD